MPPRNPSSANIILKINDEVYYEGQAIVTIMENIENNWSYVASILRIIPIDRLNQLYRWISKNRKKVFSKKQYACPNIPTHFTTNNRKQTRTGIKRKS